MRLIWGFIQGYKVLDVDEADACDETHDIYGDNPKVGDRIRLILEEYCGDEEHFHGFEYLKLLPLYQ